jgi:hypothetical protein
LIHPLIDFDNKDYHNPLSPLRIRTRQKYHSPSPTPTRVS